MNNEIDFIHERVIEIDYIDFVLYTVVDSGIWFAKFWDEEIYEDELMIENINEGLLFEGGEIFGTLVTKEEFEKFKGLKY
jgi:hypothetical protein